PPLRSANDQRELWDHIADLTTIGSDHSPCPPEMKQRENFFEVWGGIPGAQQLLSLLADKIPQEQLVKLTSENVARRFGVPEKGGIEIGKDADLAIVDLNEADLVTRESLH